MAKKKNRKWIYIGGALIIVFGTLVAVKANQKTKHAVSVAKAEEAQITEIVAANGVVQPEVEVKISSEVSGEIVDLYVKEGDSVKAGMLLLQVNPDISQSNVERAMASVQNARANFEASKARLGQAQARFKQVQEQFKRNEKLFREKVIAEAEYQISRADFESAEGEVSAAEKAVEAARYTVKSLESTLSGEQKSLQRTSIYAPMDGIVSKLNVKKGERVLGTIQMSGTELLRIADFSSMELNVDVGESDIIRVKVGDTAEIEVDAHDKVIFKGVVREVANSAKNLGVSTTDQATNFEVKISILPSSYAELKAKYPDKASPFFPGMSGMAEIHTNTVRNAIAVPIEAVSTRQRTDSTDKKGESKTTEIVFKFVDGKAVEVKVKTGIQDNNLIQILEGVDTGMQVITAPYFLVAKDLKDGDEVMITDKDNLYKNTKKD
ncbi:MAG: HlyD family efflux transporter periplasmic adaptor subunit [Bacteroidetes bacterium]|nr:MAG: HlyD family efflux transporter periplasmic adaptor subunit [Bacteroidota bacterium]